MGSRNSKTKINFKIKKQTLNQLNHGKKYQ